jgi:hypothetical protein
MKSIHNYSIAAVAATCLFLNAHVFAQISNKDADSIFPAKDYLSGFNVQTGLGLHAISPKFSDATTNYSVNAESSTSLDLNLGVGYTHYMNNKYSLGALLELGAILGKDSKQSIYNNSNLVSVDNRSYKNFTQFSILPGYDIGNNKVVYAKLGVLTDNRGKGVDTYSPSGITYGLGIKKFYSDYPRYLKVKNIYGFAEISGVNYSNTSVHSNSVNNLNYTQKGSGVDMKFGVGYLF